MSRIVPVILHEGMSHGSRGCPRRIRTPGPSITLQCNIDIFQANSFSIRCMAKASRSSGTVSEMRM
jgi:hypothetical protein